MQVSASALVVELTAEEVTDEEEEEAETEDGQTEEDTMGTDEAVSVGDKGSVAKGRGSLDFSTTGFCVFGFREICNLC